MTSGKGGEGLVEKDNERIEWKKSRVKKCDRNNDRNMYKDEDRNDERDDIEMIGKMIRVITMMIGISERN